MSRGTSKLPRPDHRERRKKRAWIGSEKVLNEPWGLQIKYWWVYNDFGVTHSQSGSNSFTIPDPDRIKDLEMMVFEQRGKPGYPEKNLFEQGWELKPNWIYVCRRPWNSTPGHNDGRQMLIPKPHLANTELSLWTLSVCLCFSMTR